MQLYISSNYYLDFILMCYFKAICFIKFLKKFKEMTTWINI